MDDQGHGSHCAGVIGASHNEKGIAGINASVQIMSLKFLSKKGRGSLAEQLKQLVTLSIMVPMLLMPHGVEINIQKH